MPDPSTLAELSTVAVLIIIIFLIIDRVITPLIKGAINGRRKTPQDIINVEVRRDVSRLEKDSHELRNIVADIGTQIAVVENILKRIERGLNGD